MKKVLLFQSIFIVYNFMILICLTGCSSDNNKVPKVLEGIDYESRFDENNLQKDKMITRVINLYEEENDVKLKDVIVADIDNDQFEEYIGVFGDEYIETLLIMNDEGEEVIPVEWRNYNKNDYYENVEIINMKNSDKKFIYFSITNGYFYTGLALYEVNGKMLKRLAYKVDANNTVRHYIYDEEDDGFYDYIISIRDLEDFQKHSIHTKYDWNGIGFEEGIISVIYDNAIRDYIEPVQPIEVVKSYVDAVYLNEIVPESHELNLLVSTDFSTQLNPINLIQAADDSDRLMVKPASELLNYEVLHENQESVIIKIDYLENELFFILQNNESWVIERIYNTYEEAYNEVFYYQVDNIQLSDQEQLKIILNYRKNEAVAYGDIEIYSVVEQEDVLLFTTVDSEISYNGMRYDDGRAYKVLEDENNIINLSFMGIDETNQEVYELVLKIADHQVTDNIEFILNEEEEGEDDE